MDESYQDDLENVLKRADKASVHALIAVGFDVISSVRAREFAERYKQFAAVGLHPYEALGATEREIQSVGEMFQASPRCVAVGEIGLDYFRAEAARDAQAWLLRRQLALAAELQAPVILHIRNAYDDALDILEDYPQVRAVLHCFAGSAAQAQRALSLGHTLSFTGMVTFRKNAELLEIAAHTPLNRLMVETDAPYLAPVPHRGKRNEPGFVVHTLAAIAVARGLETDELAALTTDNANMFFGLSIGRNLTADHE